VDVSRCIQCGKCSASCPVNFTMDILPHQIIRLIELGRVETVMQSEALWLCIQCGRCTSACPKTLDVAESIQELRRAAPEQLDVAWGNAFRRFQRSFLLAIERHGRVYDAGLLFRIMLSQDRKKRKAVWPVVIRGKMRLWPSRAGHRSEIQAYFTRFWPKLGGKHA